MPAESPRPGTTLPEPVRSLVADEQARQGGRFVDVVDLDAYLAKLGAHAEILANSAGERCRGVVAYYCNNETTRQAYITLVLVDPRDRGLGIGRALVDCVLELVRRRGFTSCRLEVAQENAAAQAMYRSLGFQVIESRSGKDLMEIAL